MVNSAIYGGDLDDENETKFKRSVSRIFNSLCDFESQDAHKIFNDLKIPGVLLSLMSLDFKMVSRYYFPDDVFDFLKPETFSCLKKFASPSKLVPNLGPLFDQGQKYISKKLGVGSIDPDKLIIKIPNVKVGID
jgi:hypothetical protein